MFGTAYRDSTFAEIEKGNKLGRNSRVFVEFVRLANPGSEMWSISRNRSRRCPMQKRGDFAYEPGAELESSMCLRHRVSTSVFAMVAFSYISWSSAQGPPQPQIYWVQSPKMATSLARQFRLPILVFVTSDSCYYCRKMEQEIWSNSDIISMVETGFIPLELNAKRDAELIAALGIRAFPTTLLFTQEAKFVTGAPGYLAPNKLAGLLRSVERPQSASQQMAQSQ